MAPRQALWVALSLLTALEGQPLQTQEPGSTVSTVLSSFDEAQFQGTWYVLGLGGNTLRRADASTLRPYTATFERKDGRLEVVYAMRRGQHCVTWSYVLTPEAPTGRFSVDGSRDPEQVQVFHTDYASFATMFSQRQAGGQSILRAQLLCRQWALGSRMLSNFICLLRRLGLSSNNLVFPNLPGHRPGPGGWARVGPGPGPGPPPPEPREAHGLA
ncbi:Epididymal-specific lipocalin-12 [Galemys pyrenaicus]|uniref:Epididymal-specific lipocalin-12 n=1 Tax=Galemys pyrenaicus TaxID=202257 RepID=A0A8J6DUC5_GALPY|nr:Epididymal-specific lipocalin-12 [Galemys pyrenaicus]